MRSQVWSREGWGQGSIRRPCSGHRQDQGIYNCPDLGAEDEIILPSSGGGEPLKDKARVGPQAHCAPSPGRRLPASLASKRQPES